MARYAVTSPITYSIRSTSVRSSDREIPSQTLNPALTLESVRVGARRFGGLPPFACDMC